MRVAVVVVAWNGETLLPPALESLERQEPPPDLVVVDNGSADGTAAVARAAGGRVGARGGRFSLLAPGRNLGFTLGANAGMEAALALDPPVDLVVLLNQDATLEEGALAAMAARFRSDPTVGAVGALILYPDGATVQHAGGMLDPVRGTGRHAGHHAPVEAALAEMVDEPDYLTGAVLALRAAALRDAGLFDPLYSPGYYEDVDLCGRLRAAGWRVVLEPGARARHLESASFTDRAARFRLSERNRLLFLLPRLADPLRRAELLDAERAAAATRHPDLVEGTAGGAFDALLALPRVDRRRLPDGARRDAAAFLAELRRVAFERFVPAGP